MKTTTILIAAILTLQSAILFAGNDNISTPVTNETSAITLAALAPITPAEATFEEMPSGLISLVMLAPVTPVTADFE